MNDSVAKGGSSLVFARMLGMVLSFILFLILARHSATDAGVFRTVTTYFVIAEFLGMLGMQRWLATEIAVEGVNRWRIFLATNTVMFGVSILLVIIYIGISFTSFYSASLNDGLRLAALAVVPSGIYQCVQSALVGVGKSHLLSKYNAAEYVIRCSLAIGLIYLNYPIIYVIVVFVVTRWCIALYGLLALSRFFKADDWVPAKAEIKHVLQDAPKFVVIIIAFLLLRNSALVLLPAIINEAETAVFAVAYQLYDLILLIPSVLAITSNHVFVNKANQSNVALKRVSTQLIAITSVVMFPCIAVTAAFSQNFLLFLYGQHYLVAKNALIFLMIASGFAMIDQVLSQVMTARKDYQSDMHSILMGGISAVILTLILTHLYGATGAAAALMLATLFTVLYRLNLLKIIFPFRLLLLSVSRPAFAAIITFALVAFCLSLNQFSALNTSKYLWFSLVPLAISLYLATLFLMGGLSLAKRSRIKQFLFHH